MWQFIAGVFVGAAFGVTLMCLFVAGSRTDEDMFLTIYREKLGKNQESKSEEKNSEEEAGK